MPNVNEHYLLSALDDEQRRTVCAHSRRRQLHAGETLFRRGERAEALWWLESGQIKLYRLSDDGHQKIMHLVQPGQSFAEGVLFMDQPHYPVDAEAVTASSLRGFDRATYLGMLEHSFATCRELMRQMVLRTQRQLNEIEALTIQNARFRLAQYLLRLHHANNDAALIRLPAQKALISAQLAMRPETLSRLFRELELEGAIQMLGDSIEILDSDILQGPGRKALLAQD